MKNKKGFSLVVVVFSFITLFALAALVVDTAIISNQRTELQKAVEMTALSVASTITFQEDGGIYAYPQAADVAAIVESTFEMIKEPNILEFAKVDPAQTVVNRKSRAVKIYATMPARTYFASVLGLGVVNINAQAAAITMPSNIKNANSIIAYNPQPAVGGMAYANNAENIIGAEDKDVVSLGPGGSITLDLDEMLVDAQGPDLLIKETGHKDGYFVYAGIDNDVTGKTQWVNISCTGIPIGANYTTGEVGAYDVLVEYDGGTEIQTKFYGSAMFDLGSACGGAHPYAGQLKYANKIHIIDDNQEDGFLQENYLPGETPILTLLLGDHSSATPGADIDSVEVLNHSKLIPAKELNLDSDNDGLIDYIEKKIGTFAIAGDDYDGDGYPDEEEYNGWGFGTGTGIIYFSSPSSNDDLGVNI